MSILARSTRDPSGNSPPFMPVVGAPHVQIAAPKALYGSARANSDGLDLSNEATLFDLAETLAASAANPWHALPILADGSTDGVTRDVLNPADHRDVVGTVTELKVGEAARIVAMAAKHGALHLD